MRALNLIIQREYLAAVKTKAFLWTTILTPIIMIVVMLLPGYLMQLSNDDITKVYVVDSTNEYFKLLESSKDYTFVKIENVGAVPSKDAEGEVFALLTIDSDLSEKPKSATLFSEKQQAPRELTQYLNDVLTTAVTNKKLNAYTEQAGVDPTVIEAIKGITSSKEKIAINTRQWSEDGKEKETAGEVVGFVGMAFTFLMFFFILMNGSLVMQSVVEEKTNRIVEVIISSAKPFDLMMGKIIAVAATGMTQLVVWAVVITIGCGIAIPAFGIDLNALGGDTSMQMAGMGINPEMMSGLSALANVNWLQLLICFVFYFIGGYLIYAGLFAMFGSAANDSQEAQQLIMPITILLMLAFYVGFGAARNPEGSLAFWGSIIPFTSPIVMMVRLPLDVPMWEILLSLGLLFVTAIATTMLAGKIYRVGILMMGKKVTFKEIFRWITYK